mgnify:CR=1 FL=1
MRKTLAVLLIALIMTTMFPITQIHAATKTAAAYLADGNKLLSQNKYQDSIKAFDSALKLNSKYTEAYVGKGRAQYGLGAYEDSVKSLDKAVSLNKKYAPAFYYKGLALLELDKLPECISAYNIAITLNPKYAEAYNDKGFALEFSEKYDEALAAYNTAIKLNSKLIGAYINKAAILLTHYKKFNDANVAIDAALKLSVSNASALYIKGEILQELNNHTLAITYYDKAIKANSQAPIYYYNLGYSQFALKKYSEAVVNISKAIELYPKGLTPNTDSYYYRGLAYKNIGKYDLAIKDLNKAAQINPSYLDTIKGTIDNSKYNNVFLDMELSIPKEWSLSNLDLQTLIKVLTNMDNIEIPELYLPVIASKFPVGSTVAANPAFMLILQNLSAYPELKAGRDYLPLILTIISQQRAYKYDSNFEKVTIDSVSFDVLRCRTEEGSVMIYQNLYATVYRGHAICFALTFTNETELPELESILQTVKFKK